jgi:Fur family ferric uptake transcriptional regulator
MDSIVNARKLWNVGLKITQGRLSILECFANSPIRHLSADEVCRMLFAKNAGIGLASVYRMLAQFKEAGLLEERHFLKPGKTVYEINEGRRHDHLVCLDCGRIEEFHNPEIERRQGEIATKRGFALQKSVLCLYARCSRPDCPNRAAAVKPDFLWASAIITVIWRSSGGISEIC